VIVRKQYNFDATSTTIDVAPGGEFGHIPEPQLHATFDKYFAYFQEQPTREVNPNYTPHETRWRIAHVLQQHVIHDTQGQHVRSGRYCCRYHHPARWNYCSIAP
jgi:hypothetical protein